MKPTYLFSLCLAVAAAVGAAATCGEPGPQYCWLLFGPEAKVRVLVRLDGEAVTLEHYAGERPTGKKQRFKDRAACKDVTIHDRDGKTSYQITGLGGTVARAGAPTELFVNVNVKGPVAYRQYCDVMARSGEAKGAPVAHFHGPLTAQAQTINWKLPPTFALRLGDQPTDVRAVVGTMDAARGCWVVVRSMEGGGEQTKPAFPPGTHPFVDIEFPAKKPGAPPLKRRYALDQFC